jgi:hypothetical protein
MGFADNSNKIEIPHAAACLRGGDGDGNIYLRVSTLLAVTPNEHPIAAQVIMERAGCRLAITAAGRYSAPSQAARIFRTHHVQTGRIAGGAKSS